MLCFMRQGDSKNSGKNKRNEENLMYQYVWDEETGGLRLTTEQSRFSKEPRPVYASELTILGFDQYWSYPKDDHAPLMWAEANNYIYKGRTVAKTKGGALYTPPEIVLLEDPEPSGKSLQFVEIEKMVARNATIMEMLTQETIQKIYNTYISYKDKVDCFHVSYSGGKDSEVLLDLVQRSLPHNAFKVIFGDTGMEFPDTYTAVAHAEANCKNKEIDFYIAKAETNPMDNWRIFGPPSKTIRWCCSVHKTTPQNLLLRKIFGKSGITEMAFVGVRADESIKRSGYDYISMGTKHRGQYSCNPLLEWSSAEVYLYIFQNKLWLNEAYKKGNSRAGCLLCPMSGERHDFMRHASYTKEVDQYAEIIRSMSEKEYPEDPDLRHFIENGGWKLRNNGRDIKTPPSAFTEISRTSLEINSPKQDWKEWIKTIGSYDYDGKICLLYRNNQTYRIEIEPNQKGYTVTWEEKLLKEDPTTVKAIKNVFVKAANCVGCQECQADCPYGCLSFDAAGKVHVSDDCRKCMSCHKPDTGCLIYKSIQKPKGNGRMNNKSIDSYADHAPKIEWIKSYFELKNNFNENHTLGSVMFSMFRRFLRDAELMENNKFTHTAEILDSIGITEPAFWGIMLVNLSYAPEVGWFIRNIDFDRPIYKAELTAMLRDAGCSERGAKSVAGAYKRILLLPFGDLLNMGNVIMEGRTYQGLCRGRWQNPDARVILYALYKFAEHCGGYYQFTLSTLLDDSIERDGVSPTRIFGLDRETMIPILNGLSVNYPDFISASFSLGLDTISLREEKTSQDVLTIF